MPTILIVEDSPSLRTALCSILEHEGFSAIGVSSAEEGLRAVAAENVDCIIADFRLPGQDGLQFVRAVREQYPALPFVMMTAYGSVDIAVQAMKLGATDFISKPFEPAQLVPMIREVLEHHRILSRRSRQSQRNSSTIQTCSPDLQKVFSQARLAARVDSPVLLYGESGTGKEVLARFIHENSPRSGKPFIAVNCGAVPEQLLESEFFGHEAGAFTGATQSRPGVFEVASEGTVFLDEVAEMPPHLQVKLLRALQEHEFRRLGGIRNITASSRIIAATNRPLEEALCSGELREDFYYRLAVITLTLPPLRERKMDIRPMVSNIIDSMCANSGRHALSISPVALEMLESYAWPGNVRELENVLERAIVVANEVIQPEDLGIHVALNLNTLREATRTLEEIAHDATKLAEVEAIKRALTLTAGNKAKAAELLQVSYKTLLNKVKEYAISSAIVNSES
jgi:DNA-binding NtrC family response regulator